MAGHASLIQVSSCLVVTYRQPSFRMHCLNSGLGGIPHDSSPNCSVQVPSAMCMSAVLPLPFQMSVSA